MEIRIQLDEQQTAQLDAICKDASKSRDDIARDILVSVLDDDAAAHSNVIYLRRRA